ncbi:MAG: RIP metalloprotease RseP [Deltaproteobacteria bacterium]|nr:RIP metalloprotease RseP [Deltaproteobacteria bacterium]
MDFANLLASAGSITWEIIVFIILIGILVAVHEFGHFIVAKMVGVGVIKFSIGFGKVICKRAFGDTVYQICWIPLGGYVRLVGDVPDPITGTEPTDSAVRNNDEVEVNDDPDMTPAIKAMLKDRSRWFIEKGFWAKTAIVFAGPFFNLVLAFIVYLFTTAFYGEASLKDEPIIGEVTAESPAAAAGLIAEDKVLSINDNIISEWTRLAELIHQSGGNLLKLRVLRNGEEMSFTVQPALGDIENIETAKKESFYFIGIKRKELFDRKFIPLMEVPVSAFNRTVFFTAKTYYGLWQMVTGQVSSRNLAGPIFIFKEAGRQANKGLEYFLHFLAILSVSLAVINLLPIPILDGGHILFFTLEALVGEISMRKKEMAQQVGLALILALMVFVIHNDISNRWRRTGQIEWKDKVKQTAPQQTAGD